MSVATRPRCAACGSGGLEVFHEQLGIPVNSCLLVRDEHTAREFPTGDLVLAWCDACGFVQNVAFDPVRATYSAQYEETQGFSPTFRRFARDLAGQWADRHGLHRKVVLEVGCGKGEFLAQLCEAGDNRGIGIDPAYVEGREGVDDPRLQFIADRWSPRYASLVGDAVVCRHTLEHIAPVRDFLADITASLPPRRSTLLLFEVPDVLRVLEEPAFWDLYYEHCSYFSAGSLARLFRRCGLDLLDLSLAYEDQYVILEARAGGCRADDREHETCLPLEDDLPRLAEAVERFPERLGRQRAELCGAVEAASRLGPAVVWGAGSKAVSFLTTLGVGEQIAAAVDINPHKQHRYLAGTGHMVLGPAELVDDPPATVFVMNDIYLDEVRLDLDGRGLHPEVVGL